MYSADKSVVGTTTSNATDKRCTFSSLSPSTTYTVEIQARDIADNLSSKFSTQGTTKAYVLPTINIKSYTLQWNSIYVTVEASAGDGQIQNYQYAIKAGTGTGSFGNATTSTSNIFGGLSASTSYTVTVKVNDINGYYNTTSAYVNPQASIAVTARGSSTINVSVTKVAGSTNFSKYEYYLGSSLVATTTGSTYQFAGLSPNASYTVGVIVIDEQSNRSAKATANTSTTWINTSHRLCVVSGGANVYSDIGLSNKIGAINSGRIVTVTKVIEGVYNFVGYNGNAATAYQTHLNGYIRSSALTSVTSGCRCLNSSESAYGSSSTICDHQ